jgi:hypothetical protein
MNQLITVLSIQIIYLMKIFYLLFHLQVLTHSLTHLLTHSPTHSLTHSGAIDAQSMVVIEFKLNTTDCSPASIAEHINIVCRPIIQEKRSRRGAINNVHNKPTRKTVTAQSNRDSVLFKCTTSQASRMANTSIPAGRTASLPSTVNKDGEVVIGSKTDGGDIIFESGSILSFENESGTIADVTPTHEDNSITSGKSSQTPKTGHSLIHSLTHSFTHSLIHSLTHS